MSLNATIFPGLGIPVVSPDLCDIELGETGTTAELINERLGVYVRKLEGELDKSLCWRRPASRIVVGHSFGGMLALHWLLTKGAHGVADVDGLVLIATTAGPMYRQVRMRLVKLWNLEKRIGIERLIRMWNSESVTKTVKRITCNGRLDAETIHFQKMGIHSDAQMDIAGWRNTDWKAMRAYRTAMEGFDVRGCLGDLGIPTIVLHGTEDSLFDMENARFLAGHIPDAELRQVRGAGHALPLTHGEEVVRAVGELLGV